MELELRKDHRTSGPTEPKPVEPNAKPTTFTPPFASAGLERVRDSNC